VSLYFPDDVFRLNLALEPSQRIFQRFAFLQTHFGQIGSSSRARVKQAQLQLTARWVVVLRLRDIWQHARLAQPKFAGRLFPAIAPFGCSIKSVL
jgi:hypothetical protein